MTLALWTWVLGWEGDSPSNFWVLPTLREGDVGAAQIVLHLFMKRKSMPHNLYIARKGRARETNSKDQADTRHILLYPIDNPISALKNWKNLKNLKNLKN